MQEKIQSVRVHKAVDSIELGLWRRMLFDQNDLVLTKGIRRVRVSEDSVILKERIYCSRSPPPPRPSLHSLQSKKQNEFGCKFQRPASGRERELCCLLNFKRWSLLAVCFFEEVHSQTENPGSGLFSLYLSPLIPALIHPFHLSEGQEAPQATRQHPEVQWFTCFPFLPLPSHFLLFF